MLRTCINIWLVFVPLFLFSILLCTVVFTRTAEGAVIFPEYHFDASFQSFHLQKDSLFRDRFVFEGDIHFAFAFARMFKHYSVWGSYAQSTGMGRQDGEIMFDPRDAGYYLRVFGQRQKNRMILKVGLEHPCFHEIDRMEMRTVYWNKPFIGIGSTNSIRGVYREHLLGSKKTAISERFAWNGEWGYFVRDLFNTIHPRKLMAYHLDFIHEAVIRLQYAPFRTNWGFPLVQGSSRIVFRKKSSFQAHDFGVEWHLNRGKFGSNLFLHYTLDTMPIELTKDRLLGIGLRMYHSIGVHR